jgi:hypothetical protein
MAHRSRTAPSRNSPLGRALRNIGELCLDDYYASPLWAGRKRQWVADGGVMTCFVCGTDERIDLHHLTYRTLGSEAHEELVPLCRDHHEQAHALARIRPRVCRGLAVAHIVLAERVSAAATKAPL